MQAVNRCSLGPLHRNILRTFIGSSENGDHRDGRPSRYLANECVNRQINLSPRRRSCFRSSFRRYPGVSADISRTLQAQAYAPPARSIGNVRQFRRFKWTRSGSYIPPRSKVDSAANDIATNIRGHCRGRGWRVDRSSAQLRRRFRPIAVGRSRTA
jgi:hypothetical protein